MIAESKVTEIFCMADDFCKEFEVEMAKNALPSSPEAPKCRRRKRMMSDAEVISILIRFHFNTYRNFKHYYLSCVCGQWKHLFPRRFSYNRFVEIMPRCGVVPKFSDLEVIALGFTAEAFHFDNENYRFDHLHHECKDDLPNLISRRQFNARRKLTARLAEEISPSNRC